MGFKFFAYFVFEFIKLFEKYLIHSNSDQRHLNEIFNA